MHCSSLSYHPVHFFVALDHFARMNRCRDHQRIDRFGDWRSTSPPILSRPARKPRNPLRTAYWYAAAGYYPFSLSRYQPNRP